MADILTVACVQMCSGINIDNNLEKAANLIRRAVDRGAKLVITPENTCHIRHPAHAKRQTALTMQNHVGIPLFSALAKELSIHILIGSMTIKNEDKLMNRSFLFAPDGRIQATYDKIHLFDVQLSNAEVYHESDLYGAGDKAVVAKITDDFSLGLSICYDVRFAYLYRDLAKSGANIMCVPAAFTVPTGQAHWETLLRARAIETGAYLLASGQVGEHENGRRTYGHSMIISPWGEIIDVIEDDEGIIIADLNIDQVHKARNSVPALRHDRDYVMTHH